MLLKLLIFLLFSTTVFAQNQQPNTVVNNIYTGNGFWELNNIGIDTFKPVGIGSTNPGQKLDVQGTARMTGFTLSGNNAQTNYVLTATDSSGDATWEVSQGGGGGGSGNVGIGTTTYIPVYIGTTTIGSPYNNVMDANGNIGIGSVVPSSVLTVNGDISFPISTGINYNIKTYNQINSGDNGDSINISAGEAVDGSGGASESIQGGVVGSGANLGLNAGTDSTGNSNGGGIDLFGAVATSGGSISIAGGEYNANQTAPGTISVGGGTNTGNGYVHLYSGAPSTSSFFVDPFGIWTIGNVGINTVVPPQSLYVKGSAIITSNLGIGTGNPGQALDVQGTISSSGGYLGLQASQVPALSYAPQTSGSTSLQGNGSGGFTNVSLGATGVVGLNSSNQLVAGSGYLSSQLWQTNNTGIGTMNTNVGINSYTPGSYLDVNGTARMTGFTLTGEGANTGYVLIGNNIGVGTWMAGATLNIGLGTYSICTTSGNCPSGGGSTNPAGSNTQIQYNNGGSFGGITAVTNGTNIGIGTVDLNNALDINGNVGIASAANTGYTNQSQSNGGLAVAGNIGIGTWQPLQTLDVRGTLNIYALEATAQGNIGIGTTMIGQGGEAAVSIMSGNVGIGTWTPTATLQIGTGSTVDTFNGSNGNVSIGTKTAGSQLVVGATGGFSVNSSGSIISLSGTTNAFLNSGQLTLNGGGTNEINGSGSGSNLVLLGASGASNGLEIRSTSFNGTTDFIKFTVGNNGATNAMQIQDNSGNWGVGIGTASPAGTLDVEGTLRPIILNGLQNSNDNVGIGTFTTTKTLTIYGNIGIGTSASPGIQTGFSGSGATSCICKQFQAGLCTSATCT